MSVDDFLKSDEVRDYLDVNSCECYTKEIKDTLQRLEKMFQANYRMKEYEQLLATCEKLKQDLRKCVRVSSKFIIKNSPAGK